MAHSFLNVYTPYPSIDSKIKLAIRKLNWYQRVVFNKRIIIIKSADIDIITDVKGTKAVVWVKDSTSKD